MAFQCQRVNFGSPLFARAVSSVLLVLLAASRVAHADSDVVAPPPETYIVAPFENKSPSASLDWMCSALAVTVAERLESHPQFRPMYGPFIVDGLDRAFDAEKVAHRAAELGAKWVVSGSFSHPNWRSELTLRLYQVDTSGEMPTLKVAFESTSLADLKQLLDQIDGTLLDLLQKANFLPQGESLAQLKRRPTKDAYALTVFGRGINNLLGLGEPRSLEEAVKQFRKANLIDPKFAEAHRMLGLTFLELGDRGRAASQYAYALDLRPDYFAAVSGLTRLYRSEGSRPRALESVEKALALRPYDLDTREQYGELLWETGELDRALQELLKVVAQNPHQLAARRTLALVYAAKGDTKALATSLEQVLTLAPDDPDVRLDLGSAYMRMGDLDKAIDNYEELLKKKPKNTQALKFIGDCYRRQKEYDKATAAYQRVMKLDPQDPRPYFLLGATYMESGNDTKAEQVFQDAQQFHRYIGDAWINLGAIAYKKGDLSRAYWYLSRAVVKSASRPKAHYDLALVLSAKKDREKALDELRVAGDLDPQDAEIRYLTGVVLLRLGRLEEAKIAFTETLKRNPDHADAKYNLALLEDLDKRYGGEHSGVGAK